MSGDAKCICGHPESEHVYVKGETLECEIRRRTGWGCSCRRFVPREEARYE